LREREKDREYIIIIASLPYINNYVFFFFFLNNH